MPEREFPSAKSSERMQSAASHIANGIFMVARTGFSAARMLGSSDALIALLRPLVEGSRNRVLSDHRGSSQVRQEEASKEPIDSLLIDKVVDEAHGDGKSCESGESSTERLSTDAESAQECTDQHSSNAQQLDRFDGMNVQQRSSGDIPVDDRRAAHGEDNGWQVEFVEHVNDPQIQRTSLSRSLDDCPSSEVFEEARGRIVESLQAPPGERMDTVSTFGLMSHLPRAIDDDEQEHFFTGREENDDTEASFPNTDSTLESAESFYYRFIGNPHCFPISHNEPTCAICASDYEEPESQNPPIRLPCDGGHIMCSACVRAWFRPVPPSDGPQRTNACPMCRQQLFQYDEHWETYDPDAADHNQYHDQYVSEDAEFMGREDTDSDSYDPQYQGYYNPDIENSELMPREQDVEPSHQFYGVPAGLRLTLYEQRMREAQNADLPRAELRYTTRLDDNGNQQRYFYIYRPGLMNLTATTRPTPPAERAAPEHREEADPAAGISDLPVPREAAISARDHIHVAFAMMEVLRRSCLYFGSAYTLDGTMGDELYERTMDAFLRLVAILDRYTYDPEAISQLAKLYESALELLNESSNDAVVYERLPLPWSQGIVAAVEYAVETINEHHR